MTEADMQSLADRLDCIQRTLTDTLERAKRTENVSDYSWSSLAASLKLLDSLRMDIVALWVAKCDAERELGKLRELMKKPVDIHDLL